MLFHPVITKSYQDRVNPSFTIPLDDAALVHVVQRPRAQPLLFDERADSESLDHMDQNIRAVRAA